MNVPYLTTNQMREVDRLMIEKYKIELIQMMENAGQKLAQLARQRFLGDNIDKTTVIILAGTGGNGGGGLVCARHLHNWGANVQVFLTKQPDHYKNIPAHQLKILQQMKVNLNLFNNQDTTLDTSITLVVDAIIGYSLQGSPRGVSAHMIEWANQQHIPILALDTPSGLNTTTGAISDPVINAAITMTLALPKIGFTTKEAKKVVGELYLADISVPPTLYAEPSLNLQVENLFAKESILKLN